MSKSFLIAFLFIQLTAVAGTVDTVTIPSTAMRASFKAVVIRPDSYKKTKASYPVIYLLHGYDGKYSDWIRKVSYLPNYADAFQVMIVCPDGHRSSWYFDSPVDSSMRYETYVAKEVPEWIDKNFRTIRDRKARAITGLSMGGHGALFLGFRHRDVFGGAGSMSGGMDLYQSRNRFDIMKRLGDTLQHAENWKNYSMVNMIESHGGVNDLRILIDCGVDDFFFSSNKLLHEKMLRLKIPHEYIERPGSHSWIYWENAVKYQLYFFYNYFLEGKRGR